MKISLSKESLQNRGNVISLHVKRVNEKNFQLKKICDIIITKNLEA